MPKSAAKSKLGRCKRIMGNWALNCLKAMGNNITVATDQRKKAREMGEICALTPLAITKLPPQTITAINASSIPVIS
jgi:hypothetical protein